MGLYLGKHQAQRGKATYTTEKGKAYYSHTVGKDRTRAISNSLPLEKADKQLNKKPKQQNPQEFH